MVSSLSRRCPPSFYLAFTWKQRASLEIRVIPPRYSFFWSWWIFMLLWQLLLRDCQIVGDGRRWLVSCRREVCARNRGVAVRSPDSETPHSSSTCTTTTPKTFPYHAPTSDTRTRSQHSCSLLHNNVRTHFPLPWCSHLWTGLPRKNACWGFPKERPWPGSLCNSVPTESGITPKITYTWEARVQPWDDLEDMGDTVGLEEE